VHQATGFERHLPTGRGLLAFGTPAEAAAGIEEVNRDYGGHCRAARELAEEFLDYRKVLPRMLEISSQESGVRSQGSEEPRLPDS
jgi:hypothetical protein